MGRLIFALVLGVVALLYIWLAVMAVFGPGGFMPDNYLGLIIFLAMGGAAAFGSVNLLRQKSNR